MKNDRIFFLERCQFQTSTSPSNSSFISYLFMFIWFYFRLNKAGLLDASIVEFSTEEIGQLGKILLTVCDKLKLAKVTYKDKIIRTNNFTIINFLLIQMGPMHEEHLTSVLLTIQVCLNFRYLLSCIYNFAKWLDLDACKLLAKIGLI